MTANSIAVLPTGLGKTVIALLTMAEYLNRYKNEKCVILAPTRVLVHQHYNFLKDNLKINDDDISIITGEDYINYRMERWESKVICATPQIMNLDMKREIVRVESLSMIIFDEVHRAVGHYAYVPIAVEVYNRNKDARMIGMTASLPSDASKVKEIMKVLRAKHIELRDHESEDVKPYIQETKIEWVRLDLPANIIEISTLLRKTLSEYVLVIRGAGFKLGDVPSLKAFLNLRQAVERQKKYETRAALYSSIRLVHAISLLETQGVSSFLKFLDRLSKRKRVMGLKKLMDNKSFTEAYEIARGSKLLGLEHPKITKLIDVVSSLDGNDKAIIFASYRDSVDEIYKWLIQNGYKAGILIGKSGETGQTQKEQIESLERLKSGEYDILVATQVGEEGLDVSECKLVVFYDNVSSAVRYVQRSGRTGRRQPGRVVAFIAKGTRDEVYFHLVKKRMEQSKRTAVQFSRKTNDGLDMFIDKERDVFG